MVVWYLVPSEAAAAMLSLSSAICSASAGELPGMEEQDDDLLTLTVMGLVRM